MANDWILSGNKIYISGVDQADAVLVVARTEDSKTGKLKPALFIVPTDSPGFVKTQMEMDIIEPDTSSSSSSTTSVCRPTLWSAKPMPP